jgi:hypothetical protein
MNLSFKDYCMAKLEFKNIYSKCSVMVVHFGLNLKQKPWFGPHEPHIKCINVKEQRELKVIKVLNNYELFF